MRRWNWSIRAWLASLGVAVALPVLLLLGWIFGLEVGHESDYAQAIALRIAKATAARVASQHATSAALLERIAQQTAIRDFDSHTCDSLFAPDSSDLLFYDRDGKLVCSPNSRREDASIIASLRSSDLRSDQPIVRLIGDRWILLMAKPVVDRSGALHGTLGLVQSLDFGGVDEPLPDMVITILDRDGVVIARSKAPQNIVGRKIENAEVAKIALREGEGKAEAHGFDGLSRQYGFTRVPALQWTVYAGVPTTHVMGSVREMYLFGMAGGALIILMITIAVFMVAREIERPVTALVKAAESVAQVGYGSVDVTGGPTEIVRLSAAFNEMVERRSESERNLKALSERLLTVQELERTRVAREIHDDLGQSLTALKMDVIGFIEKSPHSPYLAPMVDRIRRTIDATVTSVQRISSELRPSVLDDLGLFAAMESEARLFEERTGIECELSIPDEMPETGAESSAALYRIFQEAMTNVARHSNASRVEVRVRKRAEELLLEVRDDGRGIAPEEISDPVSLGLAGMRERADMLGGTALIEGVPGRGTIVSIRIPLVEQAGRKP